jgi:hypothetical protein
MKRLPCPTNTTSFQLSIRHWHITNKLKINTPINLRVLRKIGTMQDQDAKPLTPISSPENTHFMSRQLDQMGYGMKKARKLN